MVSFALAIVLLPLAMAGNAHYDMSGHGNMAGTYGVQMSGQMMMMNQQMGQGQMGQNSGQWWGMESQEDMEAYMQWCEERKLQMEAQEEERKMLAEITARAEERKRMAAREASMKEAKAKREAMVAQWRMWQSQLTQTEEYAGNMEKYTMMKVKYMFSLTMDFLKFCRCSDYTAPLQRYLMFDGMTYEPGMSEAYTLDELEGIDVTNVDAVAQRMATLSEPDQIKLFFHGMINEVCGGVKTYVEQVKVWESQYNFMGN